jgi:hypothetical protein
VRGCACYQNREDAQKDKVPHSTSRLRRMSTVLKHLDAPNLVSSSSGFCEISLIVATPNQAAVDRTGSKKKGRSAPRAAMQC